MTTHIPLPFKASPAATLPWRRVSHGSTRFAADLLALQPQDGVSADALATKVAAFMPRHNPLVGCEPEDARLTGMTRSLYRRVMGLNVRPAAAAEKPAATTKLLPARATNSMMHQVA